MEFELAAHIFPVTSAGIHDGAPVNGSICRTTVTAIFITALEMQNDEFFTGLLQGPAEQRLQDIIVPLSKYPTVWRFLRFTIKCLTVARLTSMKICVRRFPMR
ncbi:hypothetical protein LH23_18700 [Cedecea neteri]|uniref:Uncharacterized protein n=1 Tax=Cedecea neteri TaxID=158822 RepID=A0AAN0S6W9_9ENTR|nr:hypothetical protein LH23_18700 [Cedecea neteri]